MKTLHQSLIDYEPARLKAIAACRGVPLDIAKPLKAAARLAEALLSPAEVAIVLSDLTGEEQEALEFLLKHGGRVEKLRFARRFGPIRPMGPARLEREKPWQNPVNPAEGLWYRGIIFKAFQITPQGSVEMFYIPVDLLPLVEAAMQPAPLAPLANGEPLPAAGEQPPLFSLSPVPAPNIILSGRGRLRENIFNLLVYLQTTPVRLPDKQRLSARDRDALAACLLPPLLPDFPPQAELDFCLHLVRRAGLLTVSHGRLRPDPDPARAWLQASPARQETLLRQTWRSDPTWNELWRVPGLVPQPTGWENSPLLARAKILEYLAQVPPGTWFAVDDFVAAIKQVDPDFQRPGGDYESWYIRDEQGRSLMGFENWDRVEGALIRYVLTHLLVVMGLVEAGLPDEDAPPTAFRLTAAAAAFLAGRAEEEPAARRPPAFLRVEADFLAYVPAQASLHDRFQLARFARLDRREPEHVVYRITQASVGRAFRNGVTADQMVAFLARATNNRTPLKVVETLRNWGRRRNTVKLERATLLRLADDSLLAELRGHPNLAPLLGEVIGPRAILIAPDNVKEVRRILVELGYLE